MHYTSKFKKWLFSFGGDILTSTLITTVETNLRTKFKHYMHNGLSNYQTKYCKTTFLALPHLSRILYNHLVVGKTTLLRKRSQQIHYYRIATKLCKSI